MRRLLRVFSRTPGNLAASVGLIAASYLFRLPPLWNARSTNSDAAVVGLQAMHILRGEHSPFLWGSGYQTSVDAYVAAAFFAVFGATPFVLMLSALSLHVLATWLVFATLRRHFALSSALLLTAPLVFTPSSVHTYALYPPRQASLTLALAAFCALDRAAARVPSRAWLFTGGLLSTLAVSADPYPMLLVPLALFYAALVAPRRLLVTIGGCAVGLVPFLLLHRLAGAKSGPLGLTLDALGHHFDLLVSECLPWALSYKVYFAHDVMDYQPWSAPLPVRVVQIAGALSVLVIVVYGLAAFFLRAVPVHLRRLGATGALTYPLAIGGFLVSVMVMDHFSMRYLAVLTLMLPFAAAPLAFALGPKRFAAFFAPHVMAAAIGGWVGYGPFVRGVVPLRETPELADDYVLLDRLRARGVDRAMADYWTAYRLTLLHGEEVIVVPKNAAEDRYRPYRAQVRSAPVFAYVFDPGRSREDLGDTRARLRERYPHVDEERAGRLTVLFVAGHASESVP
jgi:hypothetical protein